MNNNILIVDDNIDLCDGLAVLLEDENYNVSTAYNGHNGIDLFKSDEYDCVLLDVKLPDMSGFDVFRELHQLSPHTRFIIMTGYRFDQMIKLITKSDNVSLFYTPVDKHNLLITLHERTDAIAVVLSKKENFVSQLEQHIQNQGKTCCVLTSADDISGNPACDSDFFIFDMKHPVLCSLAAYMELAENNQTAATIIIINHPENIDGRTALNSTLITDCLFKPFHPGDVIEAIRKAAWKHPEIVVRNYS